MSVEQFFDFVQCSAQAENYNMIARQYDSIAADKHSFAVTYKPGQGHIVG